jgi:hypothetical protein
MADIRVAVIDPVIAYRKARAAMPGDVILDGDGNPIGSGGGSGLTYKGAWNANTNSPSLSSGVGDQGDYYIVSVAGTTTLDGVSDWTVGDWAVFNGTAWQKIDATNDVTSVFGRQGAVIAVANDYNADQIEWSTTHDHINSVQDVIDHSWSPGACKFGGSFALTDNGDGTVDIANGSVVLRNADTKHATLEGFAVTGVTNLSLTDEATNIIFLDYNGGSPIIDVTTNLNLIFEDNTKVGIYSVNRLGNNIYVVDYRSYNVDYIRANSFKDFNKYGIEHASGSSIADLGSLQFSVTEGLYYVASLDNETADIDTSAGGTFEYVYQDGGGGWTRVTGQSTIDNANYDDGSGTLASVTAGYYTSTFLYVILDATATTYKAVYDTSEHATLSDAQAEGSPASLPSDLNGSSNAVFIGKIITQQGVTAFADIQSPFDATLVSSSPTNHNNLSGLQGGASDDYQHLTTSEVSDVGANTTHRTSDGTDHTFIDQDVTTTASPEHVGMRLNSLNTGDNLIKTDTDGDLKLL